MRWLACLHLSLLLAWAILAIRRGQGPPAAAALGIAGICARAFWLDVWLRGADPPRWLERCSDGELVLQQSSGRREAVRVSGSSLTWGRQAMLLVLRGSRTWRLWLGPGNVPGEALASLRRDLAGRGRAAGTDRAQSGGSAGLR